MFVLSNLNQVLNLERSRKTVTASYRGRIQFAPLPGNKMVELTSYLKNKTLMLMVSQSFLNKIV